MRDEWLDDRLLQAYMEGFYGFGNYAGAYWFVGMEEGGGADAAYVTAKINAWRDHGRHELEGRGKKPPGIAGSAPTLSSNRPGAV